MYITVDDVRTAGLTEFSVDDDTVTNSILLWQDVIERYCGQWFEPRDGDFTLDGTDSDSLLLNFPIISVSALYANNTPVPIDPTYYRVYNGRRRPNDDRRNPRIQFISPSGERRDIYTASYGSAYFRKGRQNQRIVGSFGFVEYDGSTPKAIQRALTKLVIQKIARPIYVDSNDPSPSLPLALPPVIGSGIVTDQWTDWHRIKYAETTTALPGRRDGMVDVIDDPEVRGLLKLYRKPLAIATPANASWR